MSVSLNVITPQGLEPLQFPTKFRSPSEDFFHQSACNGVQFDDLREGQAVTFEEGQGPKGPRAENVALVHE